MVQREINRAVARATGESVATIQRLGFLLSEQDSGAPEDEILSAEVIDWDALAPTGRRAQAETRRRACA